MCGVGNAEFHFIFHFKFSFSLFTVTVIINYMNNSSELSGLFSEITLPVFILPELIFYLRTGFRSPNVL